MTLNNNKSSTIYKLFIHVVEGHYQDFSDSQIAQLLQLGLPLVQEYLAIYHDHPQPDSQHRLQEQMIRLKQAVKPKKGAV